MKRQVRTIILGGGLAGLAAAHRLGKEYRLFEKRRTLGGLCNTVEENGYRFDRTGHLLHLRPGKVRNTVLRLLDETPLCIARRSRIFSHGVYTDYPFQANTFGLPVEVVIECLTKFVEARCATGPAPVAADEDFEAFIHRHFGAGIARHFMIPYNTKLWGVHPREITSAWCQRFVPIPSVEEVVKGAFAQSRESIGYNASFFYPKRGIEALFRAFAATVHSVETLAAARAIDYRRKRIYVHGKWYEYQSLITTIPLKDLVALLVEPPAKVLAAAQTLRCSSLRYLDVALDRKCGTDHHWSYVPEKRFPFYRVGCYSNFSEEMAPPGKSNLYVELASRAPVHLNALMPRVEKGLREMGIITHASDIAFVRPRKIDSSYVIYNDGYAKSVPILLEWLETHGLFSAGRYARWEYASMEDAIAEGFDAADKTKDLR